MFGIVRVFFICSYIFLFINQNNCVSSHLLIAQKKERAVFLRKAALSGGIAGLNLMLFVVQILSFNLGVRT